jgi:HEAT repeat protein
MNQILSWISGGDLRSDGLANEVAEFVLENPHTFEDLFAGLSEEDDVVRGRAADAIEKISRRRPDLPKQRIPELIRMAGDEPVAMVKMHLAMLFGHMVVYPECTDQLMAVLLQMLDDSSVFTRSWAIVSLCILARKYPEKYQTILEHLSKLQADESVAIRTRVKKAVHLLVNPDAQFPDGWIKSELLQDI